MQCAECGHNFGDCPGGMCPECDHWNPIPARFLTPPASKPAAVKPSKYRLPIIVLTALAFLALVLLLARMI